ncbi:MAG TPA: hypothetical protein VFR44_11930 [Actinomycetota bacterium]|nr:hypothetical protein [Actinomycetota bacterium]
MRRELGELAPADPSGAYERIVEKRIRRRVRRRIQAGVVAAAVFGVSLVSILALGRSLGPKPTEPAPPTGMVIFQRYLRCGDRPDISTWGLEVTALDVATGELRAAAWGETLRGDRSRSEEWPDASPDGRSFVWVDRYEDDVYVTDIASGETRRLTRNLGAGQPRFSPDGSSILFQAANGPDGRGIYTVRPDGADLTFLGAGGSPTWTSEGRIAFMLSVEDTPSTRFYVMDADGSNTELVYEASGSVRFGRAEWSPDGTRVVADATVRGNTDIYVLDLRLRTPFRLTDDPAQDTSPTWSPDGDYIVFHTGRWGTELGHAELALIRADGSGLRRLTNDCFGDFMPSWVENDTTLRSLPVWTEPPLPDLGEPSVAEPDDILVSGTVGGFSDLFAVDPAMGQIRNLTADHAPQLAAAWSPDHQRIVFTGDLEDDGRYDLYVMDRDGSNLQRLTKTPETEDRPAWSPDGSRIAFGGDAGLYVMDSDGTDVVHLAGFNSVGGIYAAWSPDSSQIAFVQQRQIWIVGADGSDPRALQDRSGSPVLGWELAWSPDGARLAFTCGHDLCLVQPDGSRLGELTAGSGLSDARNADWSPDGTRLVFLGSPGQDEGAALYVIDADGGNLTRLTPLDPEWGCCREPDW